MKLCQSRRHHLPIDFLFLPHAQGFLSAKTAYASRISHITCLPGPSDPSHCRAKVMRGHQRDSVRRPLAVGTAADLLFALAITAAALAGVAGQSGGGADDLLGGEVWPEAELASNTVLGGAGKCYIALFGGAKCKSDGGVYLLPGSSCRCRCRIA